MVLLANFTPILPYPGLILWTAIIFCVFWFVMRNFAFRPIIDALEKRDNTIEEALADAQAARKQMENFTEESSKVLGEARAEQSSLIKEARTAKDVIIKEAKEKARLEANGIIGSARQEINAEKKTALAELKKDSGAFALSIAEKIIKKQLTGKADNVQFANGLVKDIKLN